jgi:alkanesulfonate monooxygenase SsuD/methylene tetrahydromethanopterin reductase-like flavin-dependent oxidoreductase (luciferase family)
VSEVPVARVFSWLRVPGWIRLHRGRPYGGGFSPASLMLLCPSDGVAKVNQIAEGVEDGPAQCPKGRCASDSAPAVIPAAAAARTRQIRPTSTVSVLGTVDPVRLFQSFSTLDLISEGRAEMVVGRGSSIESFPLLGHFGFQRGVMVASRFPLGFPA